MKILAIETSCDETAAAVISGSKTDSPKILSSVVASQIDLHKTTRGIVPEAASRAHVEKIIPVIQESLEEAKVKLNEIDMLAVTTGPGLVGSLLIGIDTAKTLSYSLNISVIPINHIEAHIFANFEHKIGKSKIPARHRLRPQALAGGRNPKSEKITKLPNYRLSQFPAIALIVSGGHTQIILMHDHGNYKLLGSTIDDAAGEAFDKVARILGLSYPGGPSISAAADIESQKSRVKSQNYGLASRQFDIKFPRPMIDSNNFDFSFSGLKTAVLYKVKETTNNYKSPLNHHLITVIAREFQNAVVDVLAAKTIRAARLYKAKCIMMGGGVASNRLLRQRIKETAKNDIPNCQILTPSPSLCTDNAAVIGINAYYKYLNDRKAAKNWQKIKLNLNPSL